MPHVDDATLEPDDLATVTAGLRAAWQRRHPGMLDDVMPEAIRMSESRTGDPSVTLAEQAHSGLLVALWLKPDAAAKLALPNGEAADGLHITLTYTGDVEEFGELVVARAIAAVEREVKWRTALSGTIGGYGRFTASDTSDAMDVFYATVDVPGLAELRNLVAGTLVEAGCPPSSRHGWTPHVTLAYIAPDADNPVDRLSPVDLEFDQVTIMVAGGRRIDIPLSPATDAIYPLYPTSFAEPASLHPDRGIGKDGCRFHNNRRPLAFVDGASEWVQFLPPPGTYSHVLYGELDFTAEKFQRMVANFASGVYGQTLPINCEHDMPASGAVGYIADMRIAADGSIEVRPEWNERGTSLIEGDRFRYVSAEFFESWQDPVTGDWHDDVAFGMAICTNPHFKETVLRPLAASEQRQQQGEHRMTGTTEQDKKPTVLEEGMVALTEAEATRLREADTRLTAAEQRAESAEGQVTELTERVTAMEKDARRVRFTSLVAGRGGANDGQVWFGDASKHVALLETLANQFGEDGDEVKTYIEQQQGIAAQLKTSGLFTELGTSHGGEERDVDAKIAARVDEVRKANPKLSREQAEDQVYREHPDLYKAAMEGKN